MNQILNRLARLIVFIAAPLALAGCGINDIPSKQETAKARWADVQAAYQRRADLIPNLVETVKGFAQQERTVLDEVTNARAKATAVNIDASTITDPAAFQRFQQAQDQLSSSLGRLLAVSERYPDLKSNANFLALQSQLEGTENRIEIARRDYNDAVRDYNTTLRVFPTSMWHATFYSGAKPMTPFAAAAGAETAPAVHFNLNAPASPAAGAPTAAPAPANAAAQ
ncbi:MAG: LemA family protein [Caulobacterales bacterium]